MNTDNIDEQPEEGSAYLQPAPASAATGKQDDFSDYMRNARDKFCETIKSHERSIELLVAAEDILICFDQMRERISNPVKQESDAEQYMIEAVAEKWSEDNAEWIRDVKEFNTANSLYNGFMAGYAFKPASQHSAGASDGIKNKEK